jgi:hypothetical protein
MVRLSALTPEETRNGRVMSRQCMFGAALSHERRLALNLWDDLCPHIKGIEFAIATGEASPTLRWDGRLCTRATLWYIAASSCLGLLQGFLERRYASGTSRQGGSQGRRVSLGADL